MELHEQQQQHLQPDVIPTPYTLQPSAVADEGVSVASSVDEVETELARNCIRDAESPGDCVIEHQLQAASDVTVRSPPDFRSADDGGGVPVCAPSYNFGRYPITMTCPCCDYTILTYVQYDISTKQYLICIALYLCLLWPCSLIPCLFRGMYDVYHFCPVCRRLIGVYKA